MGKSELTWLDTKALAATPEKLDLLTQSFEEQNLPYVRCGMDADAGPNIEIIIAPGHFFCREQFQNAFCRAADAARLPDALDDCISFTDLGHPRIDVAMFPAEDAAATAQTLAAVFAGLHQKFAAFEPAEMAENLTRLLHVRVHPPGYVAPVAPGNPRPRGGPPQFLIIPEKKELAQPVADVLNAHARQNGLGTLAEVTFNDQVKLNINLETYSALIVSLERREKSIYGQLKTEPI